MKNSYKAAAGIAGIALLIGTAVPAFAATSGTSSADASTAKVHGFKTPGTKQAPRGDGALAGLGLTQAQIEAVHTALKSAREQAHASSHAAAVAALLSAGTITQAQADAISAAKGPEALHALVTAGTVTKDQLKALHDADHAGMPTDPAKEASSVLAALVSDGTITQAQADSVSTALASRPARSERGPSQGTSTQGQARLEKPSKGKGMGTGFGTGGKHGAPSQVPNAEPSSTPSVR